MRLWEYTPFVQRSFTLVSGNCLASAGATSVCQRISGTASLMSICAYGNSSYDIVFYDHSALSYVRHLLLPRANFNVPTLSLVCFRKCGFARHMSNGPARLFPGIVQRLPLQQANSNVFPAQHCWCSLATVVSQDSSSIIIHACFWRILGVCRISS